MNQWWMWIVLGLILAAIELATPGGFFVIFFGVAALAVGILSLAGLITEPWLQWLAFSVLAILALRLFRQPLLARLRRSDPGHPVDSLVGETAVATVPIEPGGLGRVEMRGSTWDGRNVGARTISPAERCRVVAVEGLRLDVAPT